MFNTYDDIPANYRRIILQETGYKRIKNVHLDLCNEIIEDHLQYEKDMEELMNFELRFKKPGSPEVTEVFKTAKEAFARLDFEMDYDIKTPIIAYVKQADRVVRAIVGGKVYEGVQRGKIEVKPMPPASERNETYTLFNGGARCD
jgi:hypothetical protein